MPEVGVTAAERGLLGASPAPPAERPHSGWGPHPLRRQRLVDVLREAQPAWSARELASATARLVQAGVDSPGKLADALRGRLNERLRDAGQRTFNAETVRAIRRSLLGQHPALAAAVAGAAGGAEAGKEDAVAQVFPGRPLDKAILREVAAARFQTVYVFKSPLARWPPAKRTRILHQIVILCGAEVLVQLEFFVGGARYQVKTTPEVHRKGAELVAQFAPAASEDGFCGSHVARMLRSWLERERRNEDVLDCIDFAMQLVEAIGPMPGDLKAHFDHARSEFQGGAP